MQTEQVHLLMVEGSLLFPLFIGLLVPYVKSVLRAVCCVYRALRGVFSFGKKDETKY